MGSDRKLLNLVMGLVFVVALASALSTAVENAVGVVVVSVLAVILLGTVGREIVGELWLAREMHPRNDPTPEQIAAWNQAHPPVVAVERVSPGALAGSSTKVIEAPRVDPALGWALPRAVREALPGKDES